MKDESTYGFNKPDAGALLEKIELRDELTHRGRRNGRRGGSGSCKLVVTPIGGIAARVSTAVSSATCNLVGITSGTIGTTSGSITVYNPWPIAIPASYYVVAKQESETGTWLADFPGLLNVRWSSPNLEQTVDGGTYSTIDTAEECP